MLLRSPSILPYANVAQSALGTVIRERTLQHTITSNADVNAARACYVINSFALVAAPALAGATFIAMFASAFPAELGLCLWLIIMGVNVPKWNERYVPKVVA
jgi:hypothetical protein